MSYWIENSKLTTGPLGVISSLSSGQSTDWATEVAMSADEQRISLSPYLAISPTGWRNMHFSIRNHEGSELLTLPIFI